MAPAKLQARAKRTKDKKTDLELNNQRAAELSCAGKGLYCRNSSVVPQIWGGVYQGPLDSKTAMPMLREVLLHLAVESRQGLFRMDALIDNSEHKPA